MKLDLPGKIQNGALNEETLSCLLPWAVKTSNTNIRVAALQGTETELISDCGAFLKV